MNALRFLSRRPLAGRLAASLARLRAAEAGVAAVEFALVLPVMVTLYFGLAEITAAVINDRKLDSLSRSLADLTSRFSILSSSDLSNIFDAAVMTMRPYDSSGIQMVVTSVKVTKSGNSYNGNVDWSCGRHMGTKPGNMSQAAFDAANLSVRASGSSYTVPPGFQSDSTQSFILVETLMPYQPTLGQFITNTINFRETTPWPVRSGTSVTFTPPCPS